MKIEILGTGCPKCQTLFKVTQEAVRKVGKIAQIEKVEDVVKIMEYQVMSTPALVVDGTIKSTGKVLSVDEVVELIS